MADLSILWKSPAPPLALMVGDRELVDLTPKALGMKTCLVWALKPSIVADITLPPSTIFHKLSSKLPLKVQPYVRGDQTVSFIPDEMAIRTQYVIYYG